MFAKANAFGSIVGVIAVLLACSTEAQDDAVSIAIERLEEDIQQDRNSCVASELSITNLLLAIQNTSSEIDKVRGLRWLSTMPFWKASIPKAQYWRLFLDLSRDSESFAIQYYAGIAMIMERNELISAVAKMDMDQVNYYLEQNELTNSVYADVARLLVLQDALWKQDELSDAEKIDADQLENIQTLFSTVFLSSEAERFFEPTSIIQDLYYSEKLLYGIFSDAGKNYFDSILLETGISAQVAFDPNQGVSQVDPRFMNPGRIAADSLFGPQSRLCSSTEQELSRNKFFRLARDGRGEILNPIYMMEEVCRGSTQGSSVAEIKRAVAAAENRDYRVIVGHTRDGVVRFSRMSPDALYKEISNHVADYKPAKELKMSHPSLCLSSADEVFFNRNFNVGRFESELSSDGYIYVGEGLTRAEALELSEYIKQEREFRGAYVFRPADKR